MRARSRLLGYRHPALIGLVLGAVFGVWNLIVTMRDPLAEDTAGALLAFYGPMFALWGLIGFTAARRSGRLVDGVEAGAVVALATFVVFDLSVIARVNLFLDAISQRADWQNLLVRFQSSGFESLRAYANYEYAAGAPLKGLVSTAIGAVVGGIGGLLGTLGGSRQPRRS